MLARSCSVEVATNGPESSAANILNARARALEAIGESADICRRRWSERHAR